MRAASIVLFLLLATVLATVIVRCGYHEADSPSERPYVPSSDTAAKDAILQALENAKKSDQAIVFVHVDWAPMLHQRSFFEAFAERYISTERKPPVNFHYVNFTAVSHDYEPLTKLDGWAELEKIGGTPLSGSGELVWIKKGRVVHVESSLMFDSVRAAIVKTQQLFAE